VSGDEGQARFRRLFEQEVTERTEMDLKKTLFPLLTSVQVLKAQRNDMSFADEKRGYEMTCAVF